MTVFNDMTNDRYFQNLFLMALSFEKKLISKATF